MAKLHQTSRAFLDRVKAGTSSGLDLKHLSKWLVQNTRHPKDTTKPWSFKDHEFQIDILNDDCNNLTVRKCSQVGLSELIVRMILSTLAVLRDHTAIYTLPTSGFAADFAKTRFDPVISNSPLLADYINPDTDNVKLKQLGSNFLYILGTFTQGAAISIPADILVHDEVDFSNQQALTTFASRLGHAEGGGLRRKFSTPTVNGFGISDSFDKSSQAYYGVVCDSCHDTVFPDFFNDVIIPGFEDEVEKLETDDLTDPRYSIDEAFLKCPECSQGFTPENLMNPAKRRWVHKYPERRAHGYQVSPFDVYKVNPISHTLLQMAEYEKKADWANFKVGVPFEDAESSFLKEIMKNSKVISPTVPPEHTDEDYVGVPPSYDEVVMGIDIGKVSWVVIGRKTGRSAIDVIWVERVRQDGEGALLKRLVFLVKWFQVAKAVIDAGPDFTTAMSFVAAFPTGRTAANYYVRTKSRNTLSHISLNEEEGIASTVRTDSFDLLAKKANSGQIRLPKTKEADLLIDHLGNLKRVESTNNQGDMVANWVSTGPDHYGHALNYMNIAASLLGDLFAPTKVVGVLPMATIARLKTHNT